MDRLLPGLSHGHRICGRVRVIGENNVVPGEEMGVRGLGQCDGQEPLRQPKRPPADRGQRPAKRAGDPRTGERCGRDVLMDVENHRPPLQRPRQQADRDGLGVVEDQDVPVTTNHQPEATKPTLRPASRERHPSQPRRLGRPRLSRRVIDLEVTGQGSDQTLSYPGVVRPVHRGQHQDDWLHRASTFSAVIPRRR